MAWEFFNSAGGFSVNIPPRQVIDSNGNGTFNSLSANSLSLTNTGNLTVGNLVVGNILFPNGQPYVPNMANAITAPGSDTQVMFNIGGNLAASSAFTFNPSTNYLHVSNGSFCADGNITAGYYYGDGSNLSNIVANTANTVSNPYQANIIGVGNLVQLSVVGVSRLGNATNVKITGGNSGQVLTTDGNGNLSWSNGIGSGTSIANGASNVTIPQAGGNIYLNVSSAGSAVIVNRELWVAGNTRATVFDGSGARLTNLPAANIVGSVSSLNATVANVKITGGNIGQVLSSYGNGATYWSNIPGGLTTMTVKGRSANTVIALQNGAFGVVGRSGIIPVTI